MKIKKIIQLFLKRFSVNKCRSTCIYTCIVQNITEMLRSFASHTKAAFNIVLLNHALIPSGNSFAIKKTFET